MISAQVIHDLEYKGFIAPTSGSSASLAREFLKWNYTIGKAPEYDPMLPGRFLFP